MATFRAEVRTKRADGLYRVYIRCSHGRKNLYISTDMYIHEAKVKDGVITDQIVLGQCAIKIKAYLDKLNNADKVNSWSVKEVIEYITSENSIPRRYSEVEKQIFCGKVNIISELYLNLWT